MKTALTVQRLKEVLHYDPETGIFTWRETTARRNPYCFRKRAGSLRPLGYRAIRVDYELYQEHRLAWLYMTGHWPQKWIDHINGNAGDNRWSNLRLASQSENYANMKTHKDNRSGLKGVAFHKKQGWFARICVNREFHFLGYHDTAELAHAAYCEAAHRLRGEFARTS